jgi:hypothetical protein
MTEKLYLFLVIIIQIWTNCKVLSQQTSDSSALLNVLCFLKYVLNREQHFLFFIFWSELTLTGLATIFCILYYMLGHLHLASSPALSERVTTRCSWVPSRQECMCTVPLLVDAKQLQSWKPGRGTLWNGAHSFGHCLEDKTTLWKLSSSMELNPSWEASSCATTQELPNFCGTRRFITAFTRAFYWSLSWARSIHSIPYCPVSLRYF